MSNIYGTFSDGFVTIDTDQDVTGKKRFLNLDNEFDGTLIQPTILAESETIDTTEISFLAGASSNIQSQFAGINIVLTGLTALEQALQAIEPAPNATTVQFNNTIVLVDSVNLDIATLTNEHVEIVAAIDQIAAIGFSPGTPTDPKVYLQNGVNTMMGSATNTEYYDPATHSGTYCRAGSSLSTNWSGVDVRTGGSGEYSASLGFYSSYGQVPTMQLTTPNDSATLTSGALLATNPAQLSTFTFAAPDMFFKWDAGTSFKIDIDDHHVSRDMAFKVINGGSGGTADFQNYEHYLELPNNTAGWSIIISEGSGSDATISNPDGLWFYGHGISGYTQQSNFNLKKWSTARITLVPSIVFAPGFAWAVSMY